MSEALQGKIAWVTGASRGIGRAVSIDLARRGVNVALIARNRAGLEETRWICEEQGHKIRVELFEADLAQTSRLEELFKGICKDFGPPDFLINNAGISERTAADQSELKYWDRMLDINLRALVYLSRLSIDEMKKKGGGAIINIASVSGKQVFPKHAMYNASKHGVVGFSGSLFEDIREFGIKVCAICPGFVKTEMIADVPLNLEKTIQPEDIAEAVRFVLEFPDTACPTEILVRPQRNPRIKRS